MVKVIEFTSSLSLEEKLVGLDFDKNDVELGVGPVFAHDAKRRGRLIKRRRLTL
jgi:hypothetical protein